MTSPKRYWMTVVERDAPAGIQPEFPVHPQPDVFATRRTFLKAAGFSLAGLAASCRRAPEHALPQVQLSEVAPGSPSIYASTCGACEARCGLLVTTHDGRPTKIEGNPDHPLSGGAVCAVGQASVLGLYDSQRLAHPLKAGAKTTWAAVDADVAAAIDAARQKGGAVRLLTGTITSPTTVAMIETLVASAPNGRHDAYDPISAAAILDAHALTHGARVLPHYRFDRADVVVSLDADFLGTWIAPVEFTRGYTARRRVSDGGVVSAARHVQVESRLSLTGSKADRRLRLAPGDLGAFATHLAARVAQHAGTPLGWTLGEPPAYATTLDDLSLQLWEARGRALVVSGSQDVRVQALCNLINDLLGAYGATIDVERPSNQRQGNDASLDVLRGELARGEVAVLIVAGVNPVFDLPDGRAFGGDVRKVPLVVSVAERLDETSSLAHLVCPDHHYLESWDDAEPVAGVVSLTQPTIDPIGDTRAFVESLAAWSGTAATVYALIRKRWEDTILPRAGSTDAFPVFWNRVLEAGVAEIGPVADAGSTDHGAGSTDPAYVRKDPARSKDPAYRRPVFNADAVQPIEREIASGDALTLVLHPTVAMQDGRHAHNAWLHELPDPVTKVTWDNYASLSPATARRLHVIDGDVVRVAAKGTSIELPAFVQPGQHDGVVAVALGYGRAGTDRFATVGPAWLEARPSRALVGRNAAPFVRTAGGTRRYDGRRVDVTPTGAAHRLASTQIHHSLTVPGAMGQQPEALAIVQEVDAREIGAHAESGHEAHGDLWPADHAYPGHRWGMAIDMDSCTGCSACVVACQAENNIPVVGYDEVSRQREMHWLRIDRYYSGEDGDVSVAHQPMLCQQCENAPCETVCPVLATVHSSEGLNEQVYSRCVGTRYCANNCPYKVRRFNWFDYPREDSLQNLVLNPNVTVRTRGVMEKCTFCVQRIEAARVDARRGGTSIADGAIRTACQQTCPADAIVFGDLNDPKSRVSALARGRRGYGVLEELNTQPAVTYLKVVRRADEDPDRG